MSTSSGQVEDDSNSAAQEEVESSTTNNEETTENIGCCEGGCCNPKNSCYRFVALIFMCFLGFGSYYCYDTPGSLQNEIKDDMDVNTAEFALLYSLYSWPNVILCFIGGFLIDRVFGIRWGTIIFATLVTGGQVVYAFGGIANQYWMMGLGRFIFGIGGESLAVAQNAYTVSWFKGKELNTVFGLLLSMARIGSSVNFVAMVPIYNWVDGYFEEGYMTLGVSLLIAGVTCVFSLLCAIILGLLDKRRCKVLGLNSAETGEKVQLRDVLTFPVSFWLLCIICVTYYVTIFPFIGLAKVFFMRKFGFTGNQSNIFSTVVFMISAVASPVFGFLIDKTGRNIMWVLLAVIMTIGSHSLLTFTFLNPFVAMSIMGLAYSMLASSLWPMVSLVIPEIRLGTAYGMMQSIQNLGLALISMLAGYIVDNYGYLMLEMFYLVWLCVALVSTVLMGYMDSITDDGYLMMSSSQRKGVPAPCDSKSGVDNPALELELDSADKKND